MQKTVACEACSGQGKIYIGSSFSTCPRCGGSGWVVKLAPIRPSSAPIRGTRGSGSRSRSSGGSAGVGLGGIVLLLLIGLVAWRFVTEQALPALSQNWAWIIWYVFSVLAGLSAVVFRAKNLDNKKFWPEILLSSLILAKFILSDFWSASTTSTPSLSSLFLLSCLVSAMLLLLYKREPWGSDLFRVSNLEDFTLFLYIGVVLAPVLVTLVTVWMTQIELWGAWAFVRPLILPWVLIAFPPCIAFSLRGKKFFDDWSKNF